jgi:predicted nucleotidyltransferase
MRLSEKEKTTILKAVAEFDATAPVYLFGSRVHDQKKGGDIDLLVLSEHLDLSAKLKIKARIFQSLEEQKIDIIIAAPGTPDPFVQMVLEDGQKL